MHTVYTHDHNGWLDFLPLLPEVHEARNPLEEEVREVGDADGERQVLRLENGEEEALAPHAS